MAPKTSGNKKLPSDEVAERRLRALRALQRDPSPSPVDPGEAASWRVAEQVIDAVGRALTRAGATGSAAREARRSRTDGKLPTHRETYLRNRMGTRKIKSVTHLAKKAHCNRITVYRLFKGKNTPPGKKPSSARNRLLAALGITDESEIPE